MIALLDPLNLLFFNILFALALLRNQGFERAPIRQEKSPNEAVLELIFSPRDSQSDMKFFLKLNYSLLERRGV